MSVQCSEVEDKEDETVFAAVVREREVTEAGANEIHVSISISLPLPEMKRVNTQILDTTYS